MQFLEGCGKPLLCNKNTHDTLFSTASLKCKTAVLKKKKDGSIRIAYIECIVISKILHMVK